MSRVTLLRDLPWLDLMPTQRVLDRLYENIMSGRHDFCSMHGASGSGKTRMMLELGKRLRQNDEIVLTMINGEETDVLTLFRRSLGDEMTQSNFLRDDVLSILQALIAEGKKIVLLIDASENLNAPELKLLDQLRVACNEHSRHFFLFLFMDIHQKDLFIKRILNRSTNYTLSPVNAMQLKRLIDHANAFFGKTDDELSHAEVNRLHSLSYGYPGRVLKLITPQPKRFLTLRNVMASVIVLGLLIAGTAWFYLIKEPKNNDAMVQQEKEASVTVSSVVDGDEPDAKARVQQLTGNNGSVHQAAEAEAMRVEANNPPAMLPVKIETIKVDRAPESDEEKFVKKAPIVVAIKGDSQTTKSQETVAVKQEEKPDESSVVNRGQTETKPLKETVAKSMIKPATDSKYYIQLVEGNSKQVVENHLKGRTIPGAPIIKQVGNRWVAVIGPYGSEALAKTGIQHLPSSVKALNLSVVSGNRIGE